MYKIGIDVGGMSIKAGLVVNGEIIQRSVKETNQSGGLENIIEDITELVNDLLDKSELDDINNWKVIKNNYKNLINNEEYFVINEWKIINIIKIIGLEIKPIRKI